MNPEKYFSLASQGNRSQSQPPISISWRVENAALRPVARTALKTMRAEVTFETCGQKHTVVRITAPPEQLEWEWAEAEQARQMLEKAGDSFAAKLTTYVMPAVHLLRIDPLTRVMYCQDLLKPDVSFLTVVYDEHPQ
ncbi:hypothetical protein EPA93_33265 [Ktedonosporobacter rubrisoli]|uniref:Uncharacterized protein n=1 Tax=Ktedonosporobacter rubrisoli TaxID=2509675 RepID=A0A4V0YZQ9_KTERU|nr:hypothetical protein [Ktedonosporobacter rubrisoli]QBD80581.1 hypothetical protein EPA93_33265 [Ktedonosporobacter rubrisoli]